MAHRYPGKINTKFLMYGCFPHDQNAMTSFVTQFSWFLSITVPHNNSKFVKVKNIN